MRIHYKGYIAKQGQYSQFHNNYKWNIIFKNCESLHCTPVTDIVLYINYTQIKNKLKI